MRLAKIFIPFVLVLFLVAFYWYFRYSNDSFITPNVKELSECFGVSEKNIRFTLADEDQIFNGYERIIKNEVFVKSKTLIDGEVINITLYVNKDLIIDSNISGYERSVSLFMKEEFQAGGIPGFDINVCSDQLIKIRL